MASITALQRIGAADLADMLRQTDASVAVVDVRDDDYIGGHIKNSLNFPSRSLDATMPTLVRKLEDKDVVVFHCALSQERGPRAALKYMRETQEQQARLKPDNSASNETATAGKRLADESAQRPPTRKQTVYVLDRGFSGWQRMYGMDADLTEGYRPEIWEDE